MQSGRIHLCKVIFMWGSFEGDRITSQMKHCFSILLFSILLCHIGLLCLFVCFSYYFCNWSFQTTLWGRLSLVMSFYYCLIPKYTARVPYWNDVETTWKRRVCVVLTWNTSGLFVVTLLKVTSTLMSFENFDSFFTQ